MLVASAPAAESVAFFRGLNLNGPAVTIDGQAWEGKDSPHYETAIAAFESQQIALEPQTDDARAKMIRSSRWSNRADILLKDLPGGAVSLYVYVWEDNNPERFTISLSGQEVAAYQSGRSGRWDRLGPFVVVPQDGKLRLTSSGGAANFSGIEIWRGDVVAAAEKPSAAGVEFFEKHIRPLLVARCYDCHSADAETAEGDLLLDSRLGMRQGGRTGPAIVPGDPEKSLLLAAVHHRHPKLKLPPDEKLPDAELAVLDEWVRLGAPDPRDRGLGAAELKRQLALRDAASHWSFQPVRSLPPPTVRNDQWPQNDIDRYILASLEAKNLTPVALADKRTLLRRATFDLTGLPPTPEEIQGFLNDDSPQALATVVDRLLASPQYGARWGRHWMDVIRYADTAGDNSDFPVPELYLYRNYIVDSLNADKPYDQFLREQIAGDLLPADNDKQRNEQRIATGYIAISRRFGSIVNGYPQHLTIEDTIDNLGKAVLGLSISCARCHDHKFDPVTQHDYYGLYGIFQSTKYAWPGIELEQTPRDFLPLAGGAGRAYGVADDKPLDARIHKRGDPKNPGESVPRKFLDVLGGQRLTDEEAKSGSGRLPLAHWLTDRANPLTARVMVNRVWHYHFGRGLVETCNDFGTRGSRPTHPELLDYLAARFMEEGWSLKKLHREMLLSRTYQLSSADDETNLAIDPDNKLYWRFNRQRLDDESLRDALLALSGELDPVIPREPHPFPPEDKRKYTQHYPFKDFYPSNRRSVYLLVRRLNTLPLLALFDGADPNATTPRRDSSVTTVQALYLLNDEFIHQQAERFGTRLIDAEADPTRRLELAFELVLARPPRDDERGAATAYLAQFEERLASAGQPPADCQRIAWQSLGRVLFRLNEFVYID